MIDAVESFIAWHGAVPPDAKRIDEAEAHKYAASWVRRNLGAGIAHSWHIEAYDHNGKSWVGNYYFWPAENRWRHVFFAALGEEYGRAAVVRQRGDPDPTAS